MDQTRGGAKQVRLGEGEPHSPSSCSFRRPTTMPSADPRSLLPVCPRTTTTGQAA